MFACVCVCVCVTCAPVTGVDSSETNECADPAVSDVGQNSLHSRTDNANSVSAGSK